MTDVKQSIAAKLGVVFVAVAMMFSFVAPAQAQTAEELQAMINDLLAQIQKLESQIGGSGAGVCPFTWTRSLSQGDTGADVKKLQQYLNSNPDHRVAAAGQVGSAGMETEFYGPATAAAVSKFQVMYSAEVLAPVGLTSGTGYFGPSTRAKINALCATASGDEDEDEDSGSGDLSGGEGYLDFTDILSAAIEIDLGKSENVIEVEVEANDSDIAINRVDFMFGLRPWLYFDEVNLIIDGEEVGSLSGSGDFSETSGNYRARFSGVDAVVREGDTAEMHLELVVKSSMAGTRDGDDVDVWLPVNGVRYVDGAGLNDYGPSSAIPGTGNSGTNVTFNDNFGDGTASVSVSSNSPEKTALVLNEKSRTNDVRVLNFDVEAEDSDIEVKDVTVNLTTGTSTLGDVIYRARLLDSGGNQLKSVGVSSGNATDDIIFTDVDFTVAEGDVEEFEVQITFNRADGFMQESDVDTFTVNTVEVDGENEDYETVNDSTSVSETHSILFSGIVPEINSISHATANDGKDVTFTFEIDVTAIGKDYFISATGTDVFNLTVSGATSSAASVSDVTGIAKQSGTNVMKVSKDQTRTIKVSVLANGATSGGFVKTVLDDFTYGSLVGSPTNVGPIDLGAPDYESSQVNIIAQ